jgi:hypothetical protein
MARVLFWQIARFDSELFFLTSLKKRLISANVKDLFFCFSFLNFLHFLLSTFLLLFKNVGVKNLWYFKSPRPLVPYKNFAVALYHGGLRKTRAPSFKNIKIC